MSKNRYEFIEIGERPQQSRKVNTTSEHYNLVTKLLEAYQEGNKGVTIHVEEGVRSRNLLSGVARHVAVRTKEMHEQFRVRSQTMRDSKMFLWLERTK